MTGTTPPSGTRTCDLGDINDRRVFAFVEAQTRLDAAIAARTVAITDAATADRAMREAFDNLTPAEQARVNAAYSSWEARRV